MDLETLIGIAVFIFLVKVAIWAVDMVVATRELFVDPDPSGLTPEQYAQYIKLRTYPAPPLKHTAGRGPV